MGQTSELRLPADRDHILVAKRAAAAMGSVAGLDVDAVDDLSIAVAQACENAISCLERSGAIAGQVRIAFKLEERGLEVTVRSTVSHDAEFEARAEQARLAAARHRRAQLEAMRVQKERINAASDLALQLMGLFVDDSSYRLDERTGSLRVRLTKYRAS